MTENTAGTESRDGAEDLRILIQLNTHDDGGVTGNIVETENRDVTVDIVPQTDPAPQERASNSGNHNMILNARISNTQESLIFVYAVPIVLLLPIALLIFLK